MATAESHVPGSGQGWGTWASVAARAALQRRRWKGTCLRAWAPSMAGVEVQGANLRSLGPCRTFSFARGASPRHSALLLFASLSSMAVAIDTCCVRSLAWGWRALPELWGSSSCPIPSCPSPAAKSPGPSSSQSQESSVVPAPVAAGSLPRGGERRWMRQSGAERQLITLLSVSCKLRAN